VEGPVAVRWFHPRSGETVTGGDAAGGEKRSFNAPFDGDAVLYLQRMNP